MIGNVTRNWRTSLVGALMILHALAGAGTALLNGSSVDWNGTATEILLGVGLLAAKDGAVTGTATK